MVRVGDVRSHGRWPEYLTTAADQGVAAIVGVAFELDGEAKAGLNVYCDRAHDFDPGTIEAIQHEEALASKGLRLAVRLAGHRDTEADLQAAMASRTTIDLAVGMVMGQNRCPREDAIEILKAVSSHRNMKLRQVAADLVATAGKGPATTYFNR